MSAPAGNADRGLDEDELMWPAVLSGRNDSGAEQDANARGFDMDSLRQQKDPSNADAPVLRYPSKQRTYGIHAIGCA